MILSIFLKNILREAKHYFDKSNPEAISLFPSLDFSSIKKEIELQDQSNSKYSNNFQGGEFGHEICQW